MPRKPKRQSRASGPVRPGGMPAGRSSNSAHRRAPKRYHQCLACGGIVDPMFGLSEDSWCPHCRTGGEVYYAEGALPDPVLYGQWLMDQEKVRATPDVAKTAVPATSSFSYGTTTMKQKKLHTGIYHCPACCIEFDLVAEESLKCDRCGGPLAKGSLDEIWDDEPGDDENA